MAERDYKVVYRSRTLDKDDERSRAPKALDPYDHPYASERSRSRNYDVKDSSTSIDDRSSTTEIARSTSRTTYAVRNDDDRSRDAYTDERKSTRKESTRADDMPGRRSIVVDQRRGEALPPRSDIQIDARSNRDRGYIDIDIDRSRDRDREFIVDDRPRAVGAPYVIETRQGDLLDISIPSRNRNRAYNKDPQRYSTDKTPSPRSNTRDRDYMAPSHQRSGGGGNTTIVDRGYQQDQPRQSYDDYRSSRTPTRAYEEDRDEEWERLHLNTAPLSNARVEPPRSRAPTNASEDSYVMVSPTSTPRHRDSSTSRSAIARRDYPEPELRRRRSRSISFRDSQVQQHDASERRHERPGAEAVIVGKYLARPLSEYDNDDESVATYRSDQRTVRSERRTERSEADTERVERRDRRSQVDDGYSSRRGPSRSETDISRTKTDARRSTADYDDYDRSDTYGATNEPDRRSRAADSENYAATYRTRDEPYSPQVDYDRKTKDRSDYDRSSRAESEYDRSTRYRDDYDRGRRDRSDYDYDSRKSRYSEPRQRDEDDDRSYYSENVTKTVRESRYR